MGRIIYSRPCGREWVAKCPFCEFRQNLSTTRKASASAEKMIKARRMGSSPPSPRNFCSSHAPAAGGSPERACGSTFGNVVSSNVCLRLRDRPRRQGHANDHARTQCVASLVRRIRRMLQQRCRARPRSGCRRDRQTACCTTCATVAVCPPERPASRRRKSTDFQTPVSLPSTGESSHILCALAWSLALGGGS